MSQKIPSERVNVNDPRIVHCRGEGSKINNMYSIHSRKRSVRRCRRPRLLTKLILLLIIIALLVCAGFGVADLFNDSNSKTVNIHNIDAQSNNIISSSNIITVPGNTISISGNEVYFGGKKIDRIDT